MHVKSTLFKEVFLLKSKIFKDKRGAFSEKYQRLGFLKALGSKIDFCQDNFSHSKKGVLRGLHYQIYPYTQSKLVTVIQGRVLDVVVDVRKGSPTFGKYLTQELSDQNNLQLFIPRGFAHGYITLSEHSIFYYKVDNYYSPSHEVSIAPNDIDLDIDWVIPEKEWIQSPKDKKHQNFKDAIYFDYKKNLYV